MKSPTLAASCFISGRTSAKYLPKHSDSEGVIRSLN